MYADVNSSLITGIEFENNILTIYFQKKYFIEKETYQAVPEELFIDMLAAPSTGKFYLKHVKNIFPLKKHAMADMIIKGSIDVTKINKDWLHTGDKGVYLNFTVLYTKDEDRFKQNGMVTQDVPKDIYKQEVADKIPKNQRTGSIILGNIKDFTPKGDGVIEGRPGEETGALGVGDNFRDDLPF